MRHDGNYEKFRARGPVTSQDWRYRGNHIQYFFTTGPALFIVVIIISVSMLSSFFMLFLFIF